MIGVNKLITHRVFGGITYDADAAAYFTRSGVVDTTFKNAWNTFVLSAKSAGIYSKLLAAYPVPPDSIGATYYNAISSSYDITATAPPLHNTTGWTFDGATQYLKSGIIPNTHLATDSCTIVTRSRTSGVATGVAFGSVSSTTSVLYGRLRFTGDVSRMVYLTNASLFDVANTNGSGNFFFGALSTTSRYIRRNTSSLGTSSATHGSTPPTHEMYIGARNNIGVVDQFCPIEINFFAVTNSGLSTAECDSMSALMDTYSANVISGGR